MSFIRPHRALLALVTATLLAACGGEGPTEPPPAPALVRIDAGNQQEGVVGQSLGQPLVVTVLDAGNRPVSGTRVAFAVEPGSGTVSPSATTTDANGRAQAQWTLGTIAGTARATATVAGVTAATFTAVALAGPASALVATPGDAALGVGDTLRLRADARDQFGNATSTLAVAWSTLEPAVATVGSTSGLVTAVAQGAARIVATASGPTGTLADTVAVAVGPAGSGFCGARPLVTPALGEVVPLTRADRAAEVCVGSTIAGARFALVVSNAGTDFGAARTADVLALGSTAAPLALTDLLGGDRPAAGAPAIGGPADRGDGGFESRLRRRERQELTPLADVAREAWRARGRATAQAGDAAGLAAATAPAVGSLVTLNVQTGAACTNADNRTGRVVAVSTHAVIVADTANPTGGYTDDEFRTIGAQFDTLIHPLDTTYFGTATDINDDGRVVLFYTRAVNQLTPNNAGFLIGGFFFARDLYPRQAAGGLPACATSNEREMFYLLVPDPNGQVNGNVRAKTDVSRANLATLAHEYQHLINASGRLHRGTGPAPFEEVWLDEALSHGAEDLLFFRVRGFGTRDNLDIDDVANSQANADLFSAYAAQNFGRFYRWLVAPASQSPWAPNDSLATRGAGWHLLRYAAGRQPASDTDFFRQLVRGPATGIANLQAAVPGGDLAAWHRDWAIAVLVDDDVPSGLDAAYVIPSWNFRSVFPRLRVNGQQINSYPLATRALTSNLPARFVVAGGGAAYATFGVDPARAALLSVSLNGVPPHPDLRLSLVRVR